MAIVLVTGPAEKELSDQVLHAYSLGLRWGWPHDRQREDEDRKDARGQRANSANTTSDQGQ